jgi:hypothetical protein
MRSSVRCQGLMTTTVDFLFPLRCTHMVKLWWLCVATNVCIYYIPLRIGIVRNGIQMDFDLFFG